MWTAALAAFSPNPSCRDQNQQMLAWASVDTGSRTSELNTYQNQQTYNFIKYMMVYNLYLKYFFKKNKTILWFFSWIWYIYIMTWFICEIKSRFVLCKKLEFRQVLRSEIWWFHTLKSIFNLSLKCCWTILMGRLCLI